MYDANISFLHLDLCDVRKNPKVKIPSWLVFGCLRALAYMRSTDSVYVTQTYLARQIGATSSAVASSLKNLADAGLIEKLQPMKLRATDEHGTGGYRLLLVDERLQQRIGSRHVPREPEFQGLRLVKGEQ